MDRRRRRSSSRSVLRSQWPLLLSIAACLHNHTAGGFDVYDIDDNNDEITTTFAITSMEEEDQMMEFYE